MLSYKQFKLLQELTVKDLMDGTSKFRFPVDKYPQSKFININKVTPSIGVKTLTFYGEAPSFTRSTAGYNQTIQFKDILYSEDEPQVDKNNWYYLDDNNVWYKKPELNKHDLAVRCGCPDFRFRFSYANKKQKALFGNLISYTKKTDRPPLNPDHIPGMCKHLKNFIEALIQKEYIQDN